jgi:hypothetical protein
MADDLPSRLNSGRGCSAAGKVMVDGAAFLAGEQAEVIQFNGRRR